MHICKKIPKFEFFFNYISTFSDNLLRHISRDNFRQNISKILDFFVEVITFNIMNCNFFLQISNHFEYTKSDRCMHLQKLSTWTSLKQFYREIWFERKIKKLLRWYKDKNLKINIRHHTTKWKILLLDELTNWNKK